MPLLPSLHRCASFVAKEVPQITFGALPFLMQKNNPSLWRGDEAVLIRINGSLGAVMHFELCQ